MTLIQKYNELVRREYKIFASQKHKGHREKREAFYNVLRQHLIKTENGYVYYIPENKTFSGRIETLRFDRLPWESYAYGVKHE